MKDWSGTYVARVIAQCHERFLLISHLGDHRNGYMLANWQAVLRELVALAVPAKLLERTVSAESTATGLYHHIPLTYPLSAQGLADILGVDADEVREQLADLAVQVAP